ADLEGLALWSWSFVLHLLGEAYPNVGQRPTSRHHGGSFRDYKRSPDLLIGEIRAEAQRHDRAVAGAQGADRVEDFVCSQLRIRIDWLSVLRPPVGEQLDDETLTSGDPAGVPAGVDHDAPEPALDLTFQWVEGLQPSDRALQRILRKVVGVR